MNDDKIMVVIASIEIERRMYMFPINNKKIMRQNIKKRKFSEASFKSSKKSKYSFEGN